MTQQPIELTEDSAREYVLNHLTNLGYEDVQITNFKLSNEDGVDVVDIWFKLPNSEHRHNFTVWIENGKLYGEW